MPDLDAMAQELPNVGDVIDEIDKASGESHHDPPGALYSLPERDTARAFVDEFTEVPLDCSDIVWVATANDAARIPDPILSRMNVDEVPAPDQEGARRIAERLYRKTRAAHAWGAAFPEVLDATVAERLAAVAPREMRRALLGAFGNAKLAGRAEITAADLPTERSLRRQRMGFQEHGERDPCATIGPMIVLGIETSCDETGVALYCTRRGLLAQGLHSQVAMHERYGGVVPELASRDHIRRLLPLTRGVLADAGCTLDEVDAIAYTQGPGLAGALLVGAAVASGLAATLGRPLIGIHHLEGHLLSPLLSAQPPDFPFVALLVSGGHTQLMRVDGVGRYALLGDTLDDAAGEAFDKSAKLLGLGYPGGPAIAALAARGRPGMVALPRPMLHSGDLDFSFSGLKTAVLTAVRRGLPDEQARADLAAELQAAIVDVLVAKSLAAVRAAGLSRLVIAGGVSANRRLREALAAASAKGALEVFFPEPALCTDNGAMIAFAGALRLAAAPDAATPALGFGVRPRWPLESLPAP